jgi:hypothetical protein
MMKDDCLQPQKDSIKTSDEERIEMSNVNDEVGREQLHALLKAKGKAIDVDGHDDYDDKSQPGRRITVDSLRSVEKRVRDGMEAHPESILKASREADLHYDTYNYIRKLIVLRDSSLTEADKIKIKFALKMIEASGRFAAAKRLSEEVVERNWSLLQDKIKRDAAAVKRDAVASKSLTVRSAQSEDNLVERVRRGMEDHPDRVNDAHKAIGIGRERYATVRKLLIIQKRHLHIDERELLEKTLKKIDRDGAISREVAGVVDDFISRYWTRSKEKPHEVKRKNRAFEMTMIHICEGCESTKDIVIPPEMTQREREKAISELATSAELISRLIKRLLGEQVHHEDKEAS